MADNDTAVLDAIRDAVGQAGAHGVFGDPITQDGVTVLPVARISGGGGGGSGSGEGNPLARPGATGKDATAAGKEGSGKDASAKDLAGRGNGGGFGVNARPVGAFVIREGTVSWQPAFDLNKVILGGQIVAVAALLVLRALIKTRARRN